MLNPVGDIVERSHRILAESARLVVEAQELRARNRAALIRYRERLGETSDAWNTRAVSGARHEATGT